MEELPSGFIALAPGMGGVVFADVVLEPKDVAVLVLDDFDVAGARDERLDAGLEGFAQRPHDSIGIDPGEFRIDPLVDERFVAFLESSRNGAIGVDDFIVGRGCGARGESGEDAGRNDCGYSQDGEPSLHVILPDPGGGAIRSVGSTRKADAKSASLRAKPPPPPTPRPVRMLCL